MSAELPPRADSASAAQEPEADVYDDGYLRVEHAHFYVTCNGEVLKFSRAEFLLLSRLVRNPARMIKAEELWRYTWGENKSYNSESLRVYIYRLRQKLAPYGIQIETMINVGYRILFAATDRAASTNGPNLPQSSPDLP